MEASKLINEGRKKLVAARDRFSWSGDERQQAEELLEHILGPGYYLDDEVNGARARRFEELIARRAKGEPIPYITGWTEFRGMRLTVKPGAFVPRASSEEFAGHAIRRLARRPKPVHVDMATGIGPVALAVANEVRRAQVHGADVNARAIAQARANARKLKLRNTSFWTGDLFKPLPSRIKGKVDVITIHPPYIPRGQVRSLPEELRAWEPHESLTDSSVKGLGLFNRVAEEAPEWLDPKGWLLVECDAEAARAFRTALTRAGYRDVKSHVGKWSFSRIVAARV